MFLNVLVISFQLHGVWSMLVGSDNPTNRDLMNYIKQLNHTLDSLNSKVSALTTENSILKLNLSELQKTESTDKMVVAFTAVLSNSIDPVGQHQTIEYDNVLTNLGQAYDARHGHFTAPIKGLYQFSVTAMAKPDNALSLELVKNGVRQVIVHAANVLHGYGSSSETINLVLEKGDMVWVRWEGFDTYVNGGLYNTFSGLLIETIN